MMNFCTLFDSYYILKGISLYLSLENVSDDFHLYVMAFDKKCYDKLCSFGFKHMTVELLDDFETPELLEVKPTRSKGEYCWTAGPSVIHHFLKEYKLDSICYLDADLYFLGNPKIAYEEISNCSVAITEQGISEKNAQTYGKYCVQFMYFKNDEEGLKTLEWWRDKCLEWCYLKLEDGKYGDQKYLDQFPSICNNLHVMKNLGVGIAPWNMHRYTYSDNCLTYKEDKHLLVFYHMHGIKIELLDKSITLRSDETSISKAEEDTFFKPYASLLQQVLRQYFNKDYPVISIKGMSKGKRIEYFMRSLFRNNRFVRWIYYDIIKVKYSGHGTSID